MNNNLTDKHMNIIQKYLSYFEGYANKVYKDTEGFLTVGIGHKLTEEDKKRYKFGDYVDDFKIQLWFRQDIKESIKLAKDIYKTFDTHTVNVQIFMVLQTYNMGNNLRDFTTSNPLIEARNYGIARTNFLKSKWAKQVHARRAVPTTDLLLNKYNEKILNV